MPSTALHSVPLQAALVALNGLVIASRQLPSLLELLLDDMAGRGS